MEKYYRIVFAGQLQPGFERAQVEAAATQRLRLNDTQREQMFSGRRVTLKRALASSLADRYLAELHRIGLAAHLIEDDAPAAPPAAAAAPLAPPAPATSESFDPEKTLVASPAALNAYLAAFPEPAASASPATPAVTPRPAAELKLTEAPPRPAPATLPPAVPLRVVPPVSPSIHSAPTILADVGEPIDDERFAPPTSSLRPWFMVAGGVVVVVAVLWLVL
ncbi:MAG: hypothetical protein QM639_08285 [Rhodocyclaceae bacterium]